MIYQATQKIADKFTERNLNYDILDNEKLSAVVCEVKSKFATYKILCISRDEGNDVAVRAFDQVKFPEDKRTDMLAFANECNSKYRHVRFVVNCEDNTIQAEYDMPLASQDVGEIAFETLARFLNILNKTSEDMMRRAWA